MLHAALAIELPSETLEPPSSVANLVDWLMARRGEDDGIRRVLLDGMSQLFGFLQAFGDTGFDDVMSVVVDGRPVYVDVENRMHDIREALEGAIRCGALREGFSVLRISLSCRRDGLHVLAELKARARAGKEKTTANIRLAGRIEELMVQPSEGPRDYAVRAREWIHDPGRLTAMCRSFKKVVDELRDALAARLAGASMTGGEPEVWVISLGERQVGRLRHLGFGSTYRQAVYCPLPEYERTGAYDDPFNDYMFSPYIDLFHWIALGEVLEGHWNAPWVRVLQPSGKLLVTGDRAASFDRTLLEVDRSAVRVNSEGTLVVDNSIPHVSNLDPAEAGSPHSPGWAGESWADSGDEGESNCGGT